MFIALYIKLGIPIKEHESPQSCTQVRPLDTFCILVVGITNRERFMTMPFVPLDHKVEYYLSDRSAVPT